MSRKLLTTAVMALSLTSAAIVSTATPASALSSGEAAAIGLGAFAVGAIASGSLGGPGYHPHHVSYYDCHFVTRPRFNSLGDVIGYRQFRVCH